ncbi:MAG: LysE family translocator [Alphaproteobacteria bacterium]|nr:LysE family translocator [Alphaproteobacteria bacterium]
MLETTATFTAFLSFAFVASITPGPNNLMVLASGAAFGWRRTIPHIAGIAGGFAIMIGAVVLGLGALLEQYPQVFSVLKYAGAAWLFWLAWQLARPALRPRPAGAGATDPEPEGRPMKLSEAALFQWVNPKAWTMAIAASAAFSGLSSDPLGRMAIMSLTFLAVAPICNTIWMLAGTGLRAVMLDGSRARLISLVMAGLVVFSAISVLLSA